MERVLPFEKAVIAERCAQEGNWSKQRHPLDYWMVILVEEVGEVARAVLNDCNLETRKELVQAAAVCRAMVEQIDEVLELPDGQATPWPPKEAG